jgi:zinc protease
MRAHVRLKLILATLTVTVCAVAQTLPPGVQKLTSVEGITEYAYPNGLHLLLFPDPSKPKLTVNISYLVGSRHEGYGETGMAHLLEHMLFLRTKDGRDVKKELTDHGAEWNGSTDYDRTNYYEIVKATDDNLRWAIALEAERMVHMRIEKALLDKEMTVVRNEFEERENDPFSILQQRVMEEAYTFHNYGKVPIGNQSDIERVPIDRLAAFYQKYYQPDDAVLAIAGQFDESKALAYVAQYIGAIPRPERKLDQPYTVEPTQDGERSVTLRRVGENQGVMALYHVPATTHPDNAALEVLETIMGDQPSGRLYKAMVDNKKAVMAGLFHTEYHDPGYIMGAAILKEDQSIDDARQILLKQIESFAAEPPSKDEVERAKTRIMKQLDLEMTNSEHIGLLLTEFAAAGDWRLLFWVRDEIKKVTPDDVVRVAKTYLKPSNRTLGEFIPTKTPDRAEIAAAPDPAEVLKNFKGGAALEQGESFTPTPANIEGRVIRKQLPNGIKLVMLPKKNRGGTVYAQVNLHYGDLASLSGKGEIAGFTGQMLMRGTKQKSRQQIQDEIDRLKAHLNVGGGASSASAHVETVEANLEGAMRLSAEVLREPSFPENELEPIRQLAIASIDAGRSEPQALAGLEFNRHLYPYPPSDPRYVGTFDEQIAEAKKVTLEDIRKFHKDFYGATGAEVIVVGQFDPAKIEKLTVELLGDWKNPGRFERLSSKHRSIASENQKIETPDKKNAFFMAGERVQMNDEDPDFPAMVIANHIFGGSGSSHLFKRIRDKEGLSYGISSSFGAPTKDDAAGFLIHGIANPENTPKMEASLKDELAHVLKDGFTADEVADAKKAWMDERIVARSQDQSILGGLQTLEFWGRTYKWTEGFEAKIAALTADQVSAAFRRHIDPAALTVVKAGDFKKAGVLQ